MTLNTLFEDGVANDIGAIIHQMKGNMNKANECWEEFVTVRDENENSYSFEMFKENVEKLKRAEKESYGKNGQ
ncbi:hypothetical protein TSUD_382960 [Trifolium subterraneum]|uniref:Uncharacterized protein n=1 Tax=Trifolium subterraneum TaxID=3900 RepID=A0A2Z6NJW6_TRISU|nr:hypothetical protein TSUD_382960 [Trifolium subterraneum]